MRHMLPYSVFPSASCLASQLLSIASLVLGT